MLMALASSAGMSREVAEGFSLLASAIAGLLESDLMGDIGGSGCSSGLIMSWFVGG